MLVAGSVPRTGQPSEGRTCRAWSSSGTRCPRLPATHSQPEAPAQPCSAGMSSALPQPLASSMQMYINDHLLPQPR